MVDVRLGTIVVSVTCVGAKLVEVILGTLVVSVTCVGARVVEVILGTNVVSVTCVGATVVEVIGPNTGDRDNIGSKYHFHNSGSNTCY